MPNFGSKTVVVPARVPRQRLILLHSEPGVNRGHPGSHQDHGSRFRNDWWWRRGRWWRTIGIRRVCGTAVPWPCARGSRNRTADGKRDKSSRRSETWQSRGGRSEGDAGIKLQQPRSQIPRQLLNAASHRIRAIQFRFGRFFGSGLRPRQYRHLIPATRAGRDAAVGQQFLSLMQADFFARPVHVVAATVREINAPRMIDLDNTGAAVIKSSVVFGDDWIVHRHALKLAPGSNSSRDNGVWVNQAAISGGDCRYTLAGKSREAPALTCSCWGIGLGIMPIAGNPPDENNASRCGH